MPCIYTEVLIRFSLDSACERLHRFMSQENFCVHCPAIPGFRLDDFLPDASFGRPNLLPDGCSYVCGEHNKCANFKQPGLTDNAQIQQQQPLEVVRRCRHPLPSQKPRGRLGMLTWRQQQPSLRTAWWTLLSLRALATGKACFPRCMPLH